MDIRLKQDALIEDALKSHPLAPLPHSITPDVMNRIQKDVRPGLVTWHDFGLSLVIASCIGALFVTLQSLPPIILIKLHIQGILLYQGFLVNARWLVPAVMFGLAAFFAVLTIPALVQMSTRRER
jgi:hypothetical protein